MNALPKPLLIVALILHLVPAAARPFLIGGDEPHYALMAHSIARDGDLVIADDYDEVEQGSPAAGLKRAGTGLDRHLRVFDGRIVGIHPVGMPLLVAPFLALQGAIFPSLPPDVLLIGLTAAVGFSAFLAGWTMLVEWLGERRGTVVAFATHFGTPLWFYSRMFMTECWLASLLVFSIWAVKRDRMVLAGLLLGIAFWVKETSLIFAVPLVVVAMRMTKWRALRLLVSFSIVLAGWMAKNVVVYGQAVVTFQAFQYGNVIEGLWGITTDLGHGLIPFAPIAIVGIVAWCVSMRRDGFLLRASAISFFGYLLLVASWADWRGGSGYGPRLIVPVIPLLAVPIGHLIRFNGQPMVRRCTIALGIAGFTVNGAAVSDPWAHFWAPDLVERLLDRPLAFLLALMISGCLFLILGSRAGQEGSEGGRGSSPDSPRAPAFRKARPTRTGG